MRSRSNVIVLIIISLFSVKLAEGLVMVAGVVNQSIVGKDNSLRVTITLHIINVAFLPVAAVFLRQLAFVIAIAVAADGFTRRNLVERAFCLPA